jgi:hypothetical protein
MSLADDLKKMVGIKPRYAHAERELAKTYGLAPDRLKEVRNGQLQRGDHWDLVKGLVCFNDAGKAALERALGITAEKNPPGEAPPASPPAADPAPAAAPDSAPNTAPEPLGARRGMFVDWNLVERVDGPDASKKFEAPKAGEVRTLVAVAKVRNRRILKARDQDRVAWVRVKDSKNFRPGMQLQATFLSGEHWELVGRCPRWNGKF